MACEGDAQARFSPRHQFASWFNKRIFAFASDHITFSSQFDSGNLKAVTKHLSNPCGFDVVLAEDAEEHDSPQQPKIASTIEKQPPEPQQLEDGIDLNRINQTVGTGYTTWFYFEVFAQANEKQTRTMADVATQEIGGEENGKPHVADASMSFREISICILNLNHRKGLYENGYSVFYCSKNADTDVSDGTNAVNHYNSPQSDLEEFFDDHRNWHRLPLSQIKLTKYTVQASIVQATGSPRTLSKYQLAFRYKCQFANERVRFAFCYPYSYRHLQHRLHQIDAETATLAKNGVYYHRELLTNSLDGLRIDLLTISSTKHMESTHEPVFDGLFPLAQNQQSEQAEVDTTTARAQRFGKKKTVLISARVHPGETPSNYLLDGMLHLLLNPTDPQAIALRDAFVFKIVPMLNPDGVVRGYYRTDQLGRNLNRVYANPTADETPAVFALKSIALDCSSRSELAMFLDLHAHSNKRGCFFFGNNQVECPEDSPRTEDTAWYSRQVETKLFARLVSLHSPFLDYFSSSFSSGNMTREDLRVGSATTNLAKLRFSKNATPSTWSSSSNHQKMSEQSTKSAEDDLATSRDGCARVVLFRETKLVHLYTLECNYNGGKRLFEHNQVREHSRHFQVNAGSTLRNSLGDESHREQEHRLHQTGDGPGQSRLVVNNASKTARPGSSSSIQSPSDNVFTPYHWADVGVGTLRAIVDLFAVAPVSKVVQDSMYHSLEAMRKSLASEIKAPRTKVALK